MASRQTLGPAIGRRFSLAAPGEVSGLLLLPCLKYQKQEPHGPDVLLTTRFSGRVGVDARRWASLDKGAAACQTPSEVFDGFRLSEPSARFFDVLAARVGAAVAGRTTYEHSSHWGGGGPHPTARLFVLSHRPAPEISERQTLVTTGIADAIAAAREAAGDKDVGLMGGGVVTAALKAGLVDELILHQVPVLLGGGRPFFQALQERARLRLVEAVLAPGVTHLRYEVVR